MGGSYNLVADIIKEIKWNLEFCKENDLKPKTLIVPKPYEHFFKLRSPVTNKLQDVITNLNIPIEYREDTFIIDMEYDYGKDTKEKGKNTGTGR